MGIVKINEELHEEVRRASVTMVRSINAQAEFWMKMGMLAELNPGLTYTELLRQLLQQTVLPIASENDFDASNTLRMKQPTMSRAG